MTSRRAHIIGTIFIVAVVTASLQLSGCGTYNTWTPREPEAAPEYSCASGYYNCRLSEGTSRSREPKGGGK